MRMRNLAVLICVLGVACCEPLRSSSTGTRTIKRKGDTRSQSDKQFEETLEALLKDIRYLSGEDNVRENTARRVSSKLSKAGNTGFGDARSASGQNMYSVYIEALSNIFTIAQPLLRDRFINELPGSLVCILSERTDCGLEAELTRIVMSASVAPLHSFVASARSQTCPLTKSTSSSNFSTSYLRMEDTTLNLIYAFENMMMTALLNIPLNAPIDLILSWNNFIDQTLQSVVSYVSDFMVSIIQTPMVFIKLALQLGIEIPTLDQREQCHQGDLKQLLMWGLTHNLNWSFGASILDMFFAPDLSLCDYPGAECQSGNPQFSRSLPANTNASKPLLSCDRTSLAHLNATLCADLLQTSPQTPTSTLFSLCKALSWLSPEQVMRVWRNSCHALQSLMAPFLDEGACSQDPVIPETDLNTPQDPSFSSSSSLTSYSLSSSSSLASASSLSSLALSSSPSASYSSSGTGLQRMAPSNQSLRELLCVYENWTVSGAVDPSVVSLCAENFQVEFVARVCNNVQVFSILLADANNSWLWTYCFNNSQVFMVKQYCAYNTWGPNSVLPTLVTLCWTFEHEQFNALLCGFSLDFFNLIFSNPQNTWLRPNCTEQPDQVDSTSLVAEACLYEQWDTEDPITTKRLTVCIQNDEWGFRKHVCGNATFLAKLLKIKAYEWVRDFCEMASPQMPPTDPQISILEWCNYTQWLKIQVDPSVVGLCWQVDQPGFQANVCCDVDLIKFLTLDPLNKWITSVCVDKTEQETMVAQTCLYSEWTQSIIVDMTDLALCADMDPVNFTQKVCANRVVLQNLLANLDNTWLLQQCANHSSGIVEVVNPAQHCQYASWVMELPDAFLLAFCWDYDQPNFVASICRNQPVLSQLNQESSSVWVVTLCSTYSNYTLGSNSSTPKTAISTSTSKPSSTTSISNSTTAKPTSASNSTTSKSTSASNSTTPKPSTSISNFTTSTPSSNSTSSTTSKPSNCSTSTPNPTTSKPSSTSPSPPPSTTTPPPSTYACPVQEVVRRLNWSCSTDFAAVCYPGASELQAMLVLVRCGIEELQPRVNRLLTQDTASALQQASSLSVVLLVALEESNMTSILVTENIRLSVLESVQRYMENEKNFDNKRILLQCFGNVLTSLMQTGRDVTSDGSFLIKEYFNIPLDKLRVVLSAVDNTTLRHILQYFNRNKATLQLSDDYMQTMVSVLFQTHLARDPSLFVDLLPLFAMASPTDIQALPALYNNTAVLQTINFLLPSLSGEQRAAFGRWFARSQITANLTAGSLSIIRDTGNLIAYLPFYCFQLLSPAQLLDGLDVLLQNTLTPLQQYYIAQSLTGTFQNLTVDQFRRLGNVTCFANPQGLSRYANTEAFPAILENMKKCVGQGHRVPSGMVSTLVLSAPVLSTPSSLSAANISELSPFLPLLGTDFLSKLSESKLSSALPALASVPFSPAQAGVIVDKLSATVSLAEPGRLAALGSLVSGVPVEVLWRIPSESLLLALPNISLQHPALSPPQANTIASKLWGSPEVTGWLDKLKPLLPSTPLLSLLPRVPRLVTINTTYTQPWTTQQAIALFEQTLNQTSAMSVQDFLSLGTIATGVSCVALRRMLKDPPTQATMRQILVFLQTQPVPLHTSLKKCIIDELYRMEFFSELLGDLGAQIALFLPVSTIKKFPVDMMDALRKMVLHEPQFFMLLPTPKKLLLVDKMLQRLNMYTGVYTEEEFRGLGVMATFVADEVLLKVNRQFFQDSLAMLESLCYVGTKQGLMAQILQENRTFGPVQNWTPEVLIQVGRLLFFLPKGTLQMIPATVMTQERIERLFIRQRRWEESEFGALCMQTMTLQEVQDLFSQQQFVLQFFLGFLKVNRTSEAVAPVPSCESLHVTRPSAWSLNSLLDMSAANFTRCVELMGTDPYLTTYQLQTLLGRAKEVYGPASSLSPSVIGQLGRLSSQFSLDELGRLNLSLNSAVAALGGINSWNSKQLPVLFQRVLTSLRLTPSQLDSSLLVALGYIICGAEVTVMRNLNAVEFSKAALWLGSLRLQCTEDQQRALVGLLNNSLAFGPVSSWGTDVFLESGTLAVGLSDFEMSSLVTEQIQGLTPLAVSLIPPQKFAVVFRPVQISMFSYEQAVAVTTAQQAVLRTEQQTALSMVLNPLEDKPVVFRGNSLGVAAFPCPLCHLGKLLMLLSFLFLFTSGA